MDDKSYRVIRVHYLFSSLIHELGEKTLADVGNSQSAPVIWWMIHWVIQGAPVVGWSRAKCQSWNELETEKGKLIVSIE